MKARLGWKHASFSLDDPAGRAVNRRASLELLRAEARDELDTVVMERCRAGDDPWEFMEDLPTVDELVVSLLRSEFIVADDNRLPGPVREYRILRQIALDHPGLTETVWRMLGPIDQFDSRVR